MWCPATNAECILIVKHLGFPQDERHHIDMGYISEGWNTSPMRKG